MKQTISNLFNLSGKVAVVTGGAMGIGKGIAQRLAEAGASVLIVDIASEEDMKNTVNEITGTGGKADFIHADISDLNMIPFIVKKAIAAFGDLHILVNNAGIYHYSPFAEMTVELWDKTMNINLRGLAFLSQAAINLMIEKKHGGRIINISSVDSMKPSGSLSHYDASKGAVRMLTRSIAKEAGHYGITVNDIAPGGVNTPGVLKMAGEMSKETQAAMAAQMEQFMKAIPMQRMGEPEDIGNAALFLASDASAYMTGSTMVVDGGMLL